MINMLLRQMESFADQIKRISRVASKINKNNIKKKDFERIYKVIKEFYLETMKCFYNENRLEALQLNIKTKEFFRECDNLLEKCKEIEYVKLVEYLKKMLDADRMMIKAITDCDVRKV